MDVSSIVCIQAAGHAGEDCTQHKGHDFDLAYIHTHDRRCKGIVLNGGKPASVIGIDKIGNND